eukprot:CAMPEP_0198300278 /NCGR_PEP_ID=MMETSP1449-20131203/47555_1 /TAXON_ID=420275 /ORGANISM="Attheya septentrionalis, Strain CCMP2084" /LENGTH=565 /DNA_ID=CAMNT_0044002045 /DNA_START=100 /DNA_END=1793 /DNA_ORIENTATION=-
MVKTDRPDRLRHRVPASSVNGNSSLEVPNGLPQQQQQTLPLPTTSRRRIRKRKGTSSKLVSCCKLKTSQRLPLQQNRRSMSLGHQKEQNGIMSFWGKTIIISLVFFCVLGYTGIFTSRGKSAHVATDRPTTRRAVPTVLKHIPAPGVPCLIPRYLSKLGPQHVNLFHAKPTIDEESYSKDEWDQDFGGLEMSPIEPGESREIQPDMYAEDAETMFMGIIDPDEELDDYFGMDDDFVHNPINGSHCQRVSWYRDQYPNCNSFHERKHMEYNNHYLSHGLFRSVFYAETSFGDEIAAKFLRSPDLDFSMEQFDNIRKDAIVMERLTESPIIVDIYGFCAMSIYSELLPREVEQYVVPGEGYVDEDGLHDEDDVKPRNNYTVTEKLEMAMQMAETLAVLHGFKDGVIVHDDVQPCQWLYTKDGKLKLNDFNRAEIRMFDSETGKYCPHRNGHGMGNLRSPEEWRDGDLDESIDVFSLGNNIYSILTGLWVYYDTRDDDAVHEKSISGELPYIDPRYRTRSYAEGKLVEVIELCWTYDPAERADIFKIVAFLREANEHHKKLIDGESNA